MDEMLSRLEAELRRGTLVLAVLSGLHEKRYGYELRRSLTEAGLPVEEGTLYPLLRRLESQGLLESEWDTDGGSPRRYYRLGADGRRALKLLTEAWRRQVTVLDTLLSD
ncbi:PadR family transcriptional regulator [Actinoplanes sp. NPDC051633]|uniref:PadR family transcriptional regulator n=1 Tax=Actinoplanes sp. NPDC051633 TaxID=3155670 RepID=UPI0034465F92